MSVNDISWQTVILFIGMVIVIVNTYNTLASARRNRREETALQDAPLNAVRDRVSKLETEMHDLDKGYERIKSRLGGHDGDMRILLKSQLALLRHGIDGNNIEDLKRSQEEIQNHLVDK